VRHGTFGENPFSPGRRPLVGGRDRRHVTVVQPSPERVVHARLSPRDLATHDPPAVLTHQFPTGLPTLIRSMICRPVIESSNILTF
jgi:hypothetical protein